MFANHVHPFHFQLFLMVKNNNVYALLIYVSEGIRNDQNYRTIPTILAQKVM